MKKSTGSTYSVWMNAMDMPPTSPLSADISCEVCIVGAGIAGLTTAYLLNQEGKSVVILESKDIGSGETGRTTAHLSNALDDRYFHLMRMFGQKGARLAAESHTAAINRIEDIIKNEKINCDFERLDGYLFQAEGSAPESLDQELEAVRTLGFDKVVKLQKMPLESLSDGPCLFFPNQAIFHPLKYLSGLSRVLLLNGGRIYTHSHVVSFEKTDVVHRIRTQAGFTVTANEVVVATNTPINDLFSIHTKQAPYRTYVLGLRITPGTVPKALYWDNADPYHYIRLAIDAHAGMPPGAEQEHNLLIVGGEDHKTGQEENEAACFTRLEQWARSKFPMAQELVYRWSGQVMEPVDSLAFIGRNPGDEHVYIATGDSGHGMTHGTIAGILITDLIMGRPNAWKGLYDPSRISLSLPSGQEFLKENLNVAAQYSDYVTPGEVSDAGEVLPGSGKIIRRGLAKVAVYCDPQGKRHEMSAVCTHLGCIVHWNEVEKSWDCPCHGSRFDPMGQILSGPASQGLASVREAAKEHLPHQDNSHQG